MGQIETEAVSFIDRFHDGTQRIELYYTPILCLFGTLGNSLSLLVFCMDAQYRSQSAAYYLSALALSDTGYLLNLFAVWLESVKGRVISSDIICSMVMYLGQVTCFLSIYLIVAFSVERYVAVHYPLARAQICTRSKARKIIAGLTITGLLLFSYALFIAKVVEVEVHDHYPPAYCHENNSNVSVADKECVVITYESRCSVPEDYDSISEIANYLDTCITFIIPVLLITFFNGRIAWSLWKLKDIRREMVATTRNNRSPPSSSSSSNGSVDTANRSTRPGRYRLLTSLGQLFGRRGRTGARTRATAMAGESLEMTEVTAVAVFTTEGKVVDKVVEDENDGMAAENFLEETRCTDSSANQTEIRISQPSQQGKQQTVTLSTSSSEIRVTKALLLVSFVFLILNLPLHIFRCAQFIQTLTTATTGGKRSAEQLLTVNENEPLYVHELLLPSALLWANMLFNTNFAVNFLLYCANGRNFRKSLRKILTHRILRRNPTIQTSIFHTANNARQQYGRRTTASQDEWQVTQPQ